MKKRVFTLLLIPFLLFYALPVGAVEKEGRKWQDETIYFLMVDRFNNGDNKNDIEVNAKDPLAYHGGDFQGIIDQLDYLKDMGYTAIWLTPIFDNAENGYHGYWINDFYKTDEHFGSIDTFKKLVKEAHNRDMKVILDFVANHVAPTNPWINDSQKKSWFHEKKGISNGDNQQDLETGWVDDLPDLAQENPDVEKYLLDAAQWWIKETNIDGYRLDNVNYVPITFWEKFSKKVKETKKDFYLLGEVSTKDPNYIVKYDKAGIDGFVDNPLNEHLRTAFAKPDQTLNPLFTNWKRNEEIYEDPYVMGTFLDNHDTTRFTQDMAQNNQNPGTRWKLALTYLYSTPGIPIVYYGSEIALNGGAAPDNQRQMNFRTDKELIDYITKIGELRQQLPSLTRGKMEVLYENKGMGVYKRTYQDEVAIIAINNTSKSQHITLTTKEIEPGKELRGLLANDLVRSKNDKYELIIDREEAEIYVLAKKTGLNIPYLTVMGIVYLAFIIFIVLIWKRSKKKRTTS
ncbi:alpha-amylase family glycosyl hydrolase [Bacillus sp. CGMCC 1.16607]|uniref:alpha-amylase family glycosyl hydrolase n=1 Tax=Bacillus sp. CGMCC 1.16607 TaxID=3351842 RepID=UPI003642A04C